MKYLSLFVILLGSSVFSKEYCSSKIKILIVVATISLLNCSSTSPFRGLTLPDGSAGYTINCNSGNFNNCYEYAGIVCPTGYKIVDKNSEGGWVYVEKLGGNSTSSKGMVVKCEKRTEGQIINAERMINKKKRASHLWWMIPAGVVVVYLMVPQWWWR